MSEPVYLTAQQVADKIGVKRGTVYVYMHRGQMPTPDMIWLKRPLWLEETIVRWRKNKHKRGADVRGVPGHRVKVSERPIPRPPRLVAPSAGASAPKRRRRFAPSNRASVVPGMSSITGIEAKKIAAALRQEGHYCTTDDVLALVDHEGPLDREREVLQQRILRKIRH